jgi:hypothetical protein
MCHDNTLPFELETALERRIAEQPRWRSGVEWGRARPGHPEGTVKLHVAAILANVDRLFGHSPLRWNASAETLISTSRSTNVTTKTKGKIKRAFAGSAN